MRVGTPIVALIAGHVLGSYAATTLDCVRIAREYGQSVGWVVRAAPGPIIRTPIEPHQTLLVPTTPAPWLAALWAAYLIPVVGTLVLARRVHAARTARRRRVNGECVRCGYDLCATPELCPECGAAPADAVGPV